VNESAVGTAANEAGMSSRAALLALFGGILAAMLVVTVAASLHQPLWEWSGLEAEPDRWWTWATLVDAYFGFLTFYAWVFYKETRAVARAAWFVAIMLLGNIAMAVYVLRQLAQLPAGAPASRLLLRNADRA
jgi:membrane protease YdiL (CAAX protease family)